MKSGRLALGVLGIAVEAWALLSLHPLPGEDLQRHVVLFLAAWICYVAALAVALRLPAASLRADLVFIFAVGALLRATFLTTTPSLSDDIFRSVWDARLMHQGVNPYLYPPGAPELTAYRDEAIWPAVNAKEQRTPYLPLTEELGAAAYAVLPERPLAFQGLAAGLDLITAGLLAWLLTRLGQDPRRSLAVAWSPAGALQFAHSGHNDAALVLALAAGAVLLSYRRGQLALLALGAGVMIKAVPALALPIFARVAGWWKLAAVLALAVATALPFASAAPVLLSGLLEEGSQAQFNDGFHWVAERVARWIVPEHASATASAVGAVFMLAAIVFAVRAPRPSPRGAFIVSGQLLGLYLLVAPVVQPWYATWLAPLIALEVEPGRGRIPFAISASVAWLWFGGTSILSDLSYLPDSAGLWPAIRLIEYAPLYALLGWVVLSAWRRRRRDGGG